MLGIFLSFLLVFVSSYFITSVYTPKDGKYRCCAFLILLATMFAQLVLNIEILSLFKAINSKNILIINTVFWIVSFAWWFKNGKPFYIPNLVQALKKIWSGLKRDKFLLIMSLGLLFFVGTAIWLCYFTPIQSYDAMSYHLNRVAFWLSQGSLNHFDIADERNLVMPINSEILYLWVLTFLKNDIGLAYFSFIGYLGCVYSVYNILGYFNFSERRKLWSVIILSSFASVIAEASSSQTNVLLAGLILASIYLFLVALKEKKLSLIFFSSLLYALAMGTKSPAIIAFPGVFCILGYFSFQQYKKEGYKPLTAFCLLTFFNFLIFSSYNYILNFIDYNDFFASEPSKFIHQFRGGIKAVVANYIRYIFMLFDFSGFRYSEFVGETIVNARGALFNLFNIPAGIGIVISDKNIVNNTLCTEKMGLGLLGFLLFLPSVLTVILLTIFKKCSKKVSNLFVFAVVFFVNVFCLSFSIGYFVYSIRFITTFVLISSPVLALSYMKKNYILKIIILFFVMSYFLVMSTNLRTRNVRYIHKIYSEEKTTYDARERIRCSINFFYNEKVSYCYIRDFIKDEIPKHYKIGIFPTDASFLYVVKILETQGYRIDILLPEKIDTYDLKQYDYIIKTREELASYVLQENTERILPKLKYDKHGRQLLSKNKCLYLDMETDEPVSATTKNPQVYAVLCDVPNDYIKNNGFEIVRTFDFLDLPAPEKAFMTIYKKKS